MSNFSDVGDFHEKFDLPRSDRMQRQLEPLVDDNGLPTSTSFFRLRFLQEEVDEFEEAIYANDHAKAFDALLDVVYVAMGTAHLLGYPWEAGWDEVQRANMRKVRAQADGSDSKRGSPLDIVKPEGWTPPDIEAIIASVGAKCQACGRPYGVGHERQALWGVCRPTTPTSSLAYCAVHGCYFKPAVPPQRTEGSK